MSSQAQSEEPPTQKKRIASLESENQALKARLGAMEAKFSNLLNVLFDNEKALHHREEEIDLGIQKSLFDDFLEAKEEVEDLHVQVKRADNGAKAAIRESKAENEDGSINKTKWVEETTRDLLVTKAVKGEPAATRRVTTTDLRERSELEMDELYHKQITNGWKNLKNDWDAFRDAKKDGVKALNVDPNKITPSLVAKVEYSSGRDDLAERFFDDEAVNPPQKR